MDGDQQRPVVADAEARGHEVVGLALRGVVGRRADVLLAELEREDRDDQRPRMQARRPPRSPRVAGDEAGPGGPESAPGCFGFGRMNAGSLTDSMCRPTSESTAGSSVTAASTAVTTATADA